MDLGTAFWKLLDNARRTYVFFPCSFPGHLFNGGLNLDVSGFKIKESDLVEGVAF